LSNTVTQNRTTEQGKGQSRAIRRTFLRNLRSTTLLSTAQKAFVRKNVKDFEGAVFDKQVLPATDWH